MVELLTMACDFTAIVYLSVGHFFPFLPFLLSRGSFQFEDKRPGRLGGGWEGRAMSLRRAASNIHGCPSRFLSLALSREEFKNNTTIYCG